MRLFPALLAIGLFGSDRAHAQHLAAGTYTVVGGGVDTANATPLRIATNLALPFTAPGVGRIFSGTLVIDTAPSGAPDRHFTLTIDLVPEHSEAHRAWTVSGSIQGSDDGNVHQLQLASGQGSAYVQSKANGDLFLLIAPSVRMKLRAPMP